MHINHWNPLTVCGEFPPCESCWRISLPVQKARDFFLPLLLKPGHGDVTWNQPTETMFTWPGQAQALNETESASRTNTACSREGLKAEVSKDALQAMADPPCILSA